MNNKDKNSICRGCEISYKRDTGAGGRYCSVECKAAHPPLKKKCEPECAEANIQIKTVIFKNGTQHSRRSCLRCKCSSYVPRCTPLIVHPPDPRSISALYRSEGRART